MLLAFYGTIPHDPAPGIGGMVVPNYGERGPDGPRDLLGTPAPDISYGVYSSLVLIIVSAPPIE